MDGNRTHQGHLNSALQTVLKTAGPASTDVHQRPLEFNRGVPNPLLSTDVRHRPLAWLSSWLSKRPGAPSPRVVFDGLLYGCVTAGSVGYRWRTIEAVTASCSRMTGSPQLT